MTPPHGRKMYDSAPLNELGPIVNAAINFAQRVWDRHDPIVPANPEDEEQQFGPDGTPRAAIQGRRPRARRGPSSSQQALAGPGPGPGPGSGGNIPVAFPPPPVTARTDLSSSYAVLEPIAEYISSEEGDFEAYSLRDYEDEGWVYVDVRQQVDRQSGLSVSMMKEDPRYERDRRRKIESMGKQSGFAKVGKKVVGMFGYGTPTKQKEEDAMKWFQNERKGWENVPSRQRREGGMVRSVEGSTGARSAKHGGAKLLRSDGGERSFVKNEHRMPARDMQTSGAALQDRPRRTPFSIEEEIASAMSSMMGSTIESVRSADSRHSTTAPRKTPVQEVRSKPRHARSESVNDEEFVGKPLHHPDTPRPRHMASSGIPDNTVSWRRSRTAETSKEQPIQTSGTLQDRPRTKRHPALDFAPRAQATTPAPAEHAVKKEPNYWLKQVTENEEKTSKPNLQPTVENVENVRSVYDHPFSENNGLFDAVTKNMTEREKEQYVVGTPRGETADSERFTTFSKKEVAEARKGKKKA
ncbi:hypothetical protein BLS_005802 [Venturia inaequalis]|uniref:Uncharacterized protein n=1 Tax=Venturia inaequalis TaxID=5025 RepID=A0A8H3UF83_VENIN|nr:hypothetical protein BLS_005802 [Venturia inaequalis]